MGCMVIVGILISLVIIYLFIFYLTIFPVAGFLAFRPPGLGSYSMRATSFYSYEGLVVITFAMVIMVVMVAAVLSELLKMDWYSFVML